MNQAGGSQVVEALYRSYYNEPPAEHPKTLVSSHWRELVARFRVERGPSGTPRPIEGFGFGLAGRRGLRSRVLSRIGARLHRARLSNSAEIARLERVANRLCKSMGLEPSFDTFRQVCSAELLGQHWPSTPNHGCRVLMIGDGFGVLAGLVKLEHPEASVTLVDLGQTLFFQAYHLGRAFSHSRHALAPASGRSPDFTYCPADRLSDLDGPRFNVAVNIASMQEMHPDVIARYFDLLRSHMEPENRFYCSNRERKVLAGGEITEFAAYPWHQGDKHLVDEPCPWHNWFLDRGPTARGPRILGLRIPFVNYYDGPTRHRLTVLHTESPEGTGAEQGAVEVNAWT